MSNDHLQTAIRSLEGKASAASDNAIFHAKRSSFHEGKRREYDAEYLRYKAAIDAIREVAGMGAAAVAFDDGEGPKNVPPAKEVEAEAKASEPFHGIPNGSPVFVADIAPYVTAAGLNRHAVKQAVRDRLMHYPLAVSNERWHTFRRQAMIAACRAHPGYGEYVAKGGVNLSSNRHRETYHIKEVVDALGVDIDAAVASAKTLHHVIYTYGKEGIDFHASEKAVQS